MTEVFSPEERKIMDDPTLNLPQKAERLEKVRSELAKHSAAQTNLNTPETARELRGIVEGIKKAGDAISVSDEANETHKEKLTAARSRIRELELPDSVPTEDMITEYSRLKAYEVLMTNFLTGCDSRRAVFVSQVWARVE